MHPREKIIVGTWPLSGDFGHVDLATIQQTIDKALDLGIREFDTAPNYGRGFMEFALGKVLYGRNEVLINTKCGNLPFGGKSFRVEDLKSSIEQSCLRLQKAQINVLFLHNPRTEIADYELVFEMFETLKRAGKILKSGISLAKNVEYPEDILKRFDVIQDDANLLSLRSLSTAATLGRQFMARSPLASGLLGGRMSEATTFAADDHRSGWLKGERLASLIRRVRAIEQAADMPIASAARRFLLSDERVGGVIFGVKRPAHLDDIVKDAEIGALAPKVIENLNRLYETDFGLVDQSQHGF